jgi:hypothetical protein
VADISSKGLLPQLTDVLHALTDSHELLLRKLQSVRLGHINVVPLVFEASPHAEFLDFASPPRPALINSKIDTTSDVHRALAIDAIDESTGLTSRVRSESDVSVGITAATAQAHAETSVQLRPSAEAVTPCGDRGAAVLAQAPTPPEWPLAVHAASTDSESARSYNFFDELDARLADLAHLESSSGES